MSADLSANARRVLLLSEKHAKSLGHPYIGPEHMLLAVLDDGHGPGAKVLFHYRVTLQSVLNRLTSVVGTGLGETLEDISLTDQAQELLTRAQEFAKALGHDTIDDRHLLLSMLSDSRNLAADVLESFALSRTSLAEVLEGDINTLLSIPVVPDHSPDEMLEREFMSLTFPAARETVAESAGSQSPLDLYGVDFTCLAREGLLDPVVGRERELEDLMRILCRRTKNNPVLVGEPGVGKTAIVEGLAQLIADGQVPARLTDKKLIALDMAALIAGTKYRGEFEGRMRDVIEEVKRRRDAMVFIDELHLIVGAGAGEGSIDAANLLKPALARGDFQLIGATTHTEYRQRIHDDAALERRFQPVLVDEASIETTINILTAISSKLSEHHAIEIEPSVIGAATELSDRYIADRFLPDKALDLLDEACSETALKGRGEVTIQEVTDVIVRWTGIPVHGYASDSFKRFIEMEDFLSERLVGLEDPIKTVSRTLRLSHSGLKDPGRPGACFMFAGPTGVGKTEMAKQLAEFLFGSSKTLVRFDMSEFNDASGVQRLIGAAPGYVGFERGGELTEAVRCRPYSVILFDEIEKAPSEIYNLLLQIMDEGRLTDSVGRGVDFKNTVIIFSTNLGAIESPGGALGFGDERRAGDQAAARAMREIQGFFRPEFIGRLDEVVVFKHLDFSSLPRIVDQFICRLRSQLEPLGIGLVISEEARMHLAKQGLDNTKGARHLRRVIETEIKGEIAEFILRDIVARGDTVAVGMEHGCVHLEVHAQRRVES